MISNLSEPIRGIKTTVDIEIIWGYLALEFAKANSQEQARFLISLADSFQKDRPSMDMQMAYIAEEIRRSKQSKEVTNFLSNLLGHIEIAERVDD